MTTDLPPISFYRGIGQPAPTTVDDVIAELEQFERLERIDNGGPAYTVAKGNFGFDGAKFVRILADEVDRLRAENTAQAAKLDAVRTVKCGPVGDEAAYVTGWNDCRAEVHRALDQSGEVSRDVAS